MKLHSRVTYKPPYFGIFAPGISPQTQSLTCLTLWFQPNHANCLHWDFSLYHFQREIGIIQESKFLCMWTQSNIAMVPFYFPLSRTKIQRAMNFIHYLWYKHTLPVVQAVPNAGLSPYLPQTWKRVASKSLNSCDLRNHRFKSFSAVRRDSWPLMPCLSW